MHKYLLRIFCGIGCCQVGLLALPSDPTVVSGKVNFETHASRMNIKSDSDKAIVNWQSFSNKLGELIKIDMPDSKSAMLNRVVSDMPSEIMGMIHSNGHVYLINQNGILFGKNSNVRVGALTASTLGLSDELFLSRDDHTFLGDSKASVECRGHILADQGDVCLIGSHVVNEGSITCPRGVAALLAGKKIVVSPEKHIVICLDRVDIGEVGLEQAGLIHARNVELIADGNLYGLAVKHTGMTNAIGFDKVGGRIRLFAQNGKAEVCESSRMVALSDDGSHEIQVLGDHVEVKDRALIDASAQGKGGKIFVGGGYRGQGLPAATTTKVAKGVRLLSDAKITGTGGQVVVWSDEYTLFDGFASVRGGQQEGDGGLIEVSAPTMEYHGSVDAKAINGKTGTLLWDPSDIKMKGSGSSDGIQGTGGNPDICTATKAGAVCSVSDLNTALQSANVIVTTESAFSYPGDISLEESVSINSNGNDLTWEAGHDFTLSFNMIYQDPTNSSTFTINAANDFNVTGAAVIDFEGGSMVCTAGQDANLAHGFTFNDTTGSNSATFSLTADRYLTVGGGVTVTEANSFTLQSSDMMVINDTLTTTNTANVLLKTTFPDGHNVYDPYKAIPHINISDGAFISTNANEFTVDSAELVFVQGILVNMATGNISVSAGTDIVLGGAGGAACIGTDSGDLNITAGWNLSLIGGYTTNGCSQIGSQSTNVKSTINLDVRETISVNGSSSANGAYALIGHGKQNGDGGIVTGDINIINARNINILGGAKTDAFAQIGHVNGSTSNGITITGDITDGYGGPVTTADSVYIRGGFSSGSYALFGHGGAASPSPDSFTGSIALSSQNVTLNAGTNNQKGAFAAFGFYVDEVQNGVNVSVTSPLLEVTAADSFVLQSQANSNASAGARIITSGSSSATIDVTQMTVTTDWFAMQGGINQINPNEVFVGVFGGDLASLTSSSPLTDAVSNLTINVAEYFKMIVSQTGNNTQVQGLITNGNVGSSSVSSHTLNFNAEGEVFFCSGNNRAALRSIDTLDVNVGTTHAGSDLLVYSRGGGSAFIDCQNVSGSSSVTSGSDIVLMGANGSNPSCLQVSNALSADALTVTANVSIDVNNFSRIEHQGSGDLTVVVDNAFPTTPDMGPGAFVLSEDASIGRASGGSLRIFSSIRSQNKTAGANNVNGLTFIPGPQFVDSEIERWGVYYPNAFIGADTYTFFYKNDS